MVATVLTHRTQFHWEMLGAYINPFNPSLQSWLDAQGLSLNDPLAVQRLAGELNRQAGMLAFIDAFWFISLSFLLMIPLVWLLRRPKHHHANAPLWH